jgi:hypothetical protein
LIDSGCRQLSNAEQLQCKRFKQAAPRMARKIAAKKVWQKKETGRGTVSQPTNVCCSRKVIEVSVQAFSLMECTSRQCNFSMVETKFSSATMRAGDNTCSCNRHIVTHA